MTIPFICVLLVFILTYLSKIPLAIAMGRQPKGYDNRHPRDQQAELVGWGRRALAAHQNSFEAFPFFAAAVLIAHLTQADPVWSTRLAVTFVAARVFYNILYLANWDRLRSTVWLVGIFSTLALMTLVWWS